MTFRLPLAVVLLLAGASQAQTAPVPAAAGSGAGEVISLSPADKAAALDAAAQRNLGQTSLLAAPLGAPEMVIAGDGRPHGWVGMMVGSDGSRSIAGSTYIPLGSTGSMSVSVATGRFPGGYGYGYGAPNPTLRTPYGYGVPPY